MAIGTQRIAEYPGELLPGVVGAPRVEPCLCGGFIAVSEPRSPRLVVTEVQLHQRTTRHLAWRDRGMPGLR